MIKQLLYKFNIFNLIMRNKRNAKVAAITVVGLIIIWAMPLFALYLNDAMAAYWLGIALALAWREWVQNEIDDRRHKRDKASHESLQRWYKQKHG